MFLELPNGKTVSLNEDEMNRYLDLPDELVDDFIWKLVARGRGTDISNPFALSYAEKRAIEDDYDCEECLDELEIEESRLAFEEDIFNELDFED